jgi:hypothetical protein
MGDIVFFLHNKPSYLDFVDQLGVFSDQNTRWRL